MKTLNQITSRGVPGYVNVLGSAKTNATVSLWSPQSTAPYAATTRKGEYYRGELPLNNNTGAVWMTITNLAVLNNGSNPDIVTNTTGNTFVPKTAEVFQYDRDGNLTNDGRWTYTWDAENRLTAMTSLSSAPAGSKRKLDFAYDSKGRRIQKIVSTWNGSSYVAQSTNRFVYDGWNLIAILNPQSSFIQSFTWGIDLGGSLQGAGGVGGLLAINDAANGAHYCAYDGNGNLTALMKATEGAVTANYEYGPFGEALRLTGAMSKANPFRFSTKYQDDETDLLYYGYRYYNASPGRWLSRDPIGERGFRSLLAHQVSRASFQDEHNLFGFVANNPLNRLDALGLRAESPSGPMMNHCLDACGDAKKKGLDLGDYGGVICCAGKKYSCVWKAGTTSGANSTATAIATQCITEHENAHHDDINCPKIWCYAWPTRPNYKWGKDENAEECASYYIHSDCLQSNISRCGSDQQCLDEVQGEIDRVSDQLNRRGCSR